MNFYSLKLTAHRRQIVETKRKRNPLDFNRKSVKLIQHVSVILNCLDLEKK